MRLNRREGRTTIAKCRQSLPRAILWGLIALLALPGPSVFAQSRGPVVKVTSPVRLPRAPAAQEHDSASEPRDPQMGTGILPRSSPETGISGLLRRILPEGRTSLLDGLGGTNSSSELSAREFRSATPSGAAERAVSPRRPLSLRLPFLARSRSEDTTGVDVTEPEEIPRRVEPVTARITDVRPAPVVPMEIRLALFELPASNGEQNAAGDQQVVSNDAGSNVAEVRGQARRIANPSNDSYREPGDSTAEDSKPTKLKTRFVRGDVARLQRLASSDQPRRTSRSDFHAASDVDKRGVLISFLRNATYGEEQGPAVASATRARPIVVAQAPDGDSNETAPANAEEPQDNPQTVEPTLADAEEPRPSGSVEPATSSAEKREDSNPVKPTIVHAQELRLDEPAEPADANAGEPTTAQEDSDAVQIDGRDEDGLKSIRDLTLDIRPEEGELPRDFAAAKFLDAGEVRHVPGINRPWPLYEFSWEASAVCHRPLYFEEVNLERYGYSYGFLQPILSGAHFFGRVPALPYLMTAEPHRDCVYTLGHYPPGSYAPYHIHYPPISLRAAAVEAAVISGLIFAIP